MYLLIKNNKLITCEYKFFYKNDYFFQNKPKNITEKTDTDLHFYKSLISGLTENSWILVSTSTFNLLQLNCFG